MNANLTKSEAAALASKFRRNTYGKVSDRLIAGLISRGLVDTRSRRLTEEGIAAVEMLQRAE